MQSVNDSAGAVSVSVQRLSLAKPNPDCLINGPLTTTELLLFP